MEQVRSHDDSDAAKRSYCHWPGIRLSKLMGKCLVTWVSALAKLMTDTYSNDPLIVLVI
jgi:hypothetical protein